MANDKKATQPDRETKLRTMRGDNTGWTYSFMVPPVPANLWTAEDWLDWIGGNWFRVNPN